MDTLKKVAIVVGIVAGAATIVVAVVGGCHADDERRHER